MIVTGIIHPDSVPKPIEECKPRDASMPKNIAGKKVLSKEEKIRIHEEKYKALVQEKTEGRIVVDAYRGREQKVDYRCTVCGHTWSTTQDYFKNGQGYGCPNCKKPKPKPVSEKLTRPFAARIIDSSVYNEWRAKMKRAFTAVENEAVSSQIERDHSEMKRIVDCISICTIGENEGHFKKRDLMDKMPETKGLPFITGQTVSNSLSRLEENGFVFIKDDVYYLTEKGKESFGATL